MSSAGHEFERRASLAQQRRLSQQFKRHAWLAPPSEVSACSESGFARVDANLALKIIYAGISAFFSTSMPSTIAIAVRDTTYLLDFIEKVFEPVGQEPSVDTATDFILEELRTYEEKHLEKIAGVAMPMLVADRCPGLCSRLWAELDILPLVLPESSLTDRYTSRDPTAAQKGDPKTIDEQAESMSRKCVR